MGLVILLLRLTLTYGDSAANKTFWSATSQLSISICEVALSLHLLLAVSIYMHTYVKQC